jgi:ribosomal protein L32
MELLFFPLFGIAIGIAILVGYQRKQNEAERARQKQEKLKNQVAALTTTRCPQCAEDIKIEAKVCRYCGTDVSQHNQKEEATKAAQLRQFESQHARGEEWWFESDRRYQSLNRHQKELWQSVGSPDLTSWEQDSVEFEEWLKAALKPPL